MTFEEWWEANGLTPLGTFGSRYEFAGKAWNAAFKECKRQAIEIATSEYDPGDIASELQERLKP